MAGGLLAGSIAGRIFKLVWGLIDDEEAPDPKHGEIAYLKLVGALIAERDHPAGARICRRRRRATSSRTRRLALPVAARRLLGVVALQVIAGDSTSYGLDPL